MQQIELVAGPYLPPACRAGDWIDDEIDGLVEVGGWTATPLSWPRRKKTGRASLILTSELARAVRVESVAAICYWWGVRPTKVWMWRQALGVGRVTSGTRKLLQERTGVPPDAAARGRAKACTPESIAKMANSKRGKLAPPQTRAALLKAAKRQKPAGWGVRANAAMLGRELPALHQGPWSEDEDIRLRALSERSAPDIAALIGRSVAAVRSRMSLLGLTQARPHTRGRRLGGVASWTPDEDRLLTSLFGTIFVIDIAKKMSRTASAVQKRAGQLGLTKKRAKRDL